MLQAMFVIAGRHRSPSADQHRGSSPQLLAEKHSPEGTCVVDIGIAMLRKPVKTQGKWQSLPSVLCVDSVCRKSPP